MRRFLPAAGLVLGLACLSLPARAEGPSFDCAKAQSPTEKLICGDEELGNLDGELGEAFRAARAAAPAERMDALLREQRAWVRSRDAACGVTVQALGDLATKAGLVQCLTEQTYWRVQALRGTAADGPTPSLAAEPAAPAADAAAEAVFQVQFGLRVLGRYDGPVNGLEGKATREAVEAFAGEAGIDPGNMQALVEALRPKVQAVARPAAPAFRDTAAACTALVDLARRLAAADRCGQVEGVGLPPDYDCGQFPAMLAAGQGRPDAQAKAIWDETIASLGRLTRYPWVRGTGTCS